MGRDQEKNNGVDYHTISCLASAKKSEGKNQFILYRYITLLIVFIYYLQIKEWSQEGQFG